MSNTLYGGCLCGEIRYACSATLNKLVVCHCTDCRKASGAAAAYNARVPASAVTIVRGVTKSHVVTADSGDRLERFFCGDCGSQLFSQREALRDFLTLKVGSLDDPSHLQLGMHIWTSSAMPWVPLSEDVPQHEHEFAGLREPRVPDS